MQNSVGRRVKIVATLGPSSQSEERLRALISSGLDVARLNFSHGDYDFFKGLIQKIRTLSVEYGRPVAIMQDLQGPKLRMGMLPEEGVNIESGSRWILHAGGIQLEKNTLPVQQEVAEGVFPDLRPGHRILFDDGKLEASVLRRDGDTVSVEFKTGGNLRSKKGVNFPDTPLRMSCLTSKDLKDLEFGLQQEVDAVALSFVRSSDNVTELKELIAKNHVGIRPWVVAKIERPEALEEIDRIIRETDVLLVARGDMAVEVGNERVPMIQKDLITRCNLAGVPVITATQMLESMIQNPSPTRAEATDVANAVFDGTDAVMLSGETASGSYPVEALAMMAKIVVEAERYRNRYARVQEILPERGSAVESIEFSASRIADHVNAKAIVCITHSGMAARVASKYRPQKRIVAIMDEPIALRRLALVWGVEGVLIQNLVDTDNLFPMVEEALKNHQIAKDGDVIVITAGIPTLQRGTTNMIKVHVMGERAGRERDQILSRL